MVKNRSLRRNIILLLLLGFTQAKSQLKFIVDDFEGMTKETSDLKANGFFTYGNLKAEISQDPNPSLPMYLDQRFITLIKGNANEFGGWGKGIGLYVNLDANTDHLNFYVLLPEQSGPFTAKIQLQEDDNNSGVFETESDDIWTYLWEVKSDKPSGWQLISIPLNLFKDDNKSGDGIFNCNYKNGKLLCFLMGFEDKDNLPTQLSFDFISFSKGTLPTQFNSDKLCATGLWSKEGNTSDFSKIASEFDRLFAKDTKIKPTVVHFFQPFAISAITDQNLYPSIEKINQLFTGGYIPMITLEDHYINAYTKKPNKLNQPNLYSIIEGHFDPFFVKWAQQIKQVKGTVLLRILHEFNGDWYPWCVANNDKNPELLIKAYRHIHSIFKAQQVTNVKFIWCPNSMSVPQESWNFIMEAYPGDEYVDCVGLDVYNGAGEKSSIWRSFRKEGIENYFILGQNFPNKPLLICETASRERTASEPSDSQSKAEWIKQQSEALKSDMSEIKLLSWFNERGTFVLNSSEESRKVYLNYILKDAHFKNGNETIKGIIK